MAGNTGICLWIEKYLDSLVMAHLQSDIPDGFSFYLLRRSKVTTGAEWIKTRFGTNIGSAMSHSVVIVFALIMCLGYLAYGFIGLGKFIEIFIPWKVISPYLPFSLPESYVPHFYGIIFTMFAVFYTVLGGMKSIVWADLVQYSIMTISSIAIAVIAMKALSGNSLVVPEGWSNPLFSWKLSLDWNQIIPEVNVIVRMTLKG